ncbi:MAG: hypothetical protein ACT6FG_00235 [Methanosarcinaceae archaeon]
MKVTVAYTGINSMLLHTGKSGATYMFERNRPLQVFDKADIENYRRKQANGSPFIVTPKLQPKKHPAPNKSEGVWNRAKPKPKTKVVKEVSNGTSSNS